MTTKSIPLSNLIPSPANVRKTDTGTGIEELAASIRAHGLLQNLQVRAAANGKFEVVAGGRRLAALKLLAKRKQLAKDAPIDCHVRDGEDAREISLAENEMRRAMHPADQFDAWKALIDDGNGIEDIAARFGVAPSVVRQRLKLAAVSPKLMQLYRDGAMSLDQLMAFTVSDDHAAQEAAWFEVQEWQRRPQAIRQTLTAQHVRADDKRVRFVTLDAYAAAGGGVIHDLFQTDSEGYLTTPALLDRLVAERLEREADAVREEGWKWVEIVTDTAALPSFGEVKGKRLPVPPKTAKAIAKLEKEADRLRETDELNDEELERLEKLETEISTLSMPVYEWSDRQKARAGVLLSLAHDGSLDIERGLIRPADMKAVKSGESEGSIETDPSPRPCFSASLTGELIAHRTAALRAVLADRPEVALAATVHALLLPVFYLGDAESVLAIHASSPALRAEGLDDSPAAKQMAERHEKWTALLPDSAAAVWDWLLTQDGAVLGELLAYCVASTIEPQEGGHASQLATSLSLDMAQWWQPTVAGYLGRVAKPLIFEAVKEGKGAFEANGLNGLKKTEMAGRAAELLSGTGWLPALFKAA